MKIKKFVSQCKEYGKMADLGEIARRKFFNNCFDGALTCAGIVSGVFVLFLSRSTGYSTKYVLITGFATALAIGISGLWGAFLSEEAERKKKMLDTEKDMAIFHEEEENNNRNDDKKSLLEKAENFATIVASLVDGGAPVLGSSLPLIPFFFGITLSIMHFVFSYIILVALLIYLGIFLGQISGGGRTKYATHLVTAGLVTLLVSIILGI
jgi:predicted membrane protein (TIGR00267 family)